jgi:glycosyltransferase involved in cell wall biosynthesis
MSAKITENTKIRLHMPAIPHTITRSEFSHCAFTGKVLRFAPMMMSRGFEVYHYGVETSESGATKQIDLLTKVEWEKLRIDSYKAMMPELNEEQIFTKLKDPSQYIGNLGNITYPIYKEFNVRFRTELIKHYRSSKTDIVCFPFGPGHEDAIKGLDVIVVETGIGYPNSYKGFRIFESHAKLHMHLQKENKQLENYWFVCPNYFNITEWPLSLTPKVDTIGYFGRLEPIKGCHIVVEIARKFPTIRFILCGQGNPLPYLVSPNIVYKTPIHGSERGEYLGSLTALLAPSKWPEPFCGVSVEAQLCGTPVMGHDCGAIVENVEEFKTGLHCHTLSDFCYGVQMALDGKFDRQYIHDRAVRLFDMFVIAKRYDYVFNSILDIHNGRNGWYSSATHIDVLDNTSNPILIETTPVWVGWTIPEISKKCKFIDKIAFVPESFTYSNDIVSTNSIPRILHMIWVGDSPMPDTFMLYITQWQTLMPSWSIRIWTNTDINSMVFPQEAIDLINTATKGAQKADIMRYFIIEKYGGIYMDADVIPHRSLEPLIASFKNSSLITCHDIPLTWEYISIGFFAATPHHPVLQTACTMCYDTIVNTEDIHLKTGPFLFGHAIANTPVKLYEKHILLPSKYFYRNSSFNERFGDHTYAKQW